MRQWSYIVFGLLGAGLVLLAVGGFGLLLDGRYVSATWTLAASTLAVMMIVLVRSMSHRSSSAVVTVSVREQRMTRVLVLALLVITGIGAAVSIALRA
jgi:hypothetical protein